MVIFHSYVKVPEGRMRKVHGSASFIYFKSLYIIVMIEIISTHYLPVCQRFARLQFVLTQRSGGVLLSQSCYIQFSQEVGESIGNL